jgi:hypothetical protein
LESNPSSCTTFGRPLSRRPGLLKKENTMDEETQSEAMDEEGGAAEPSSDESPVALKLDGIGN